MLIYLQFFLLILFHTGYCHSSNDQPTGVDAGYAISENVRFKRAPHNDQPSSCKILSESFLKSLKGTYEQMMALFVQNGEKHCLPKKIVLGTQSPSKLFSFLYSLIAYGIQAVSITNPKVKGVELDKEMGLPEGSHVKGRVTVNCVAASSKVAEQPIGLGPAIQGVNGRIKSAFDIDKNGDEYYSIESFVTTENGKHVDYAIVGCMRHTPGTLPGTPTIVYRKSEGVVFPNDAYEEAEKAGFNEVTVGQKMEEMEYVTNNKDPHRDRIDTARHVLLMRTVAECMEAMRVANEVKFAKVLVKDGDKTKVATSVMLRPSLDWTFLKAEILLAGKRGGTKRNKINNTNEPFYAKSVFEASLNKGEEILNARKARSEMEQNEYEKMIDNNDSSVVFVEQSKKREKQKESDTAISGIKLGNFAVLPDGKPKKRVVLASHNVNKLIAFLYAKLQYNYIIEKVSMKAPDKTETPNADIDLSKEMRIKAGSEVNGSVTVTCVKAQAEDMDEQIFTVAAARKSVTERLKIAFKNDKTAEEYYAIQSYVEKEEKPVGAGEFTASTTVYVDYAIVACITNATAQKLAKNEAVPMIIFRRSEGVEFAEEFIEEAGNKKINPEVYKKTTAGDVMEKHGAVRDSTDPHRDIGPHYKPRHEYLATATMECMEAMRVQNDVKFIRVYVENKDPKPKHLPSQSRMSTSVLLRNVGFEKLVHEIKLMVERAEKSFKAGNIFLTSRVKVEDRVEVKKEEKEFKSEEYEKLLKKWLSEENPSVFVTEKVETAPAAKGPGKSNKLTGKA